MNTEKDTNIILFTKFYGQGGRNDTLSINFAKNSTRLKICVPPASNVDKQTCFDADRELKLNAISNIIIQHGYNIVDGNYFYAMMIVKGDMIGGISIHHESLFYKNVKIFASSPFHTSAKVEKEKLPVLNFPSLTSVNVRSEIVAFADVWKGLLANILTSL